MQGLSQSQVASICQGSLNELFSYTHVLEAVEEFAIRHLNVQFLKHLFVPAIEVEPHMVKPVELVWCHDFLTDKLRSDLSLMHQICDQLLVLLSDVTW